MKNEHLTDRLVIFIFGRRFGNTVGAKHGPYTLRVPECLWEMAPTGDYRSVTFTIQSAPCFLHRWAQTVLLGIRNTHRLFTVFQINPARTLHLQKESLDRVIYPKQFLTGQRVLLIHIGTREIGHHFIPDQATT